MGAGCFSLKITNSFYEKLGVAKYRNHLLVYMTVNRWSVKGYRFSENELLLKRIEYSQTANTLTQFIGVASGFSGAGATPEARI